MGKLIVIDGLDASGKETQVKLIFEKLKKEYDKVIRLDFPNYDKPYCEPVKMYLNGEFGKNPDDVNAYAASTFFAVDRYASYMSEWKKYYDEDYIIICDRYASSNPIYQLTKLKEEEKQAYLDWVYDFEFEKLSIPKPDMVIFIDMPPEYSFKLIEKRAKETDHNVDIHEQNKNFLIQCYESALYCADYYKWEKINTIKDNEIMSREEISQMIYETIKKGI
ncbi:MAG: deoxynucleoside kinase [Clostridia bacterium]|nr:deoxynucleoside kinase [Clostridia bacterium]